MTRIAAHLLVFVVVCGLLAGGDLVAAETWDAAADYWTSNPNCVWTYGYLPLNTLGALTQYNLAQYITGTNVIQWLNSTTDKGYVSRNFSTSPYLSPAGVWWDAGGLSFRPGVSGDRPGIQWTSPISGWVKITATLTGGDTSGTTTDGHILVNGVPVWDCAIDGFAGNPGTLTGRFGTSPEAVYTSTINVSPNDTIAYIVGWGSNQNYGHDNTSVAFNIETVAPSSASGVIAGTVRSGLAGAAVIPGVTVTAGASTAVTDVNGRYSLTVAPGAYTVSFSRDDCATLQEPFIAVVAGRTTVLDEVLYLSGTVWDASEQFSILNGNPNGVWTYGWKPLDATGTLTKYNITGDTGGWGLLQWSSSANQSWVCWNSNATPYTVPWGVYWSGHGIDMLPDSAGNHSCIRWTAPAASWASVAASFAVYSTSGGKPSGDVLVNNQLVYHLDMAGSAAPGYYQVVAPYAPNGSYSTSLQANQGDTIDCCVGWGPDSNWGGDNTGMSFVVQTTEPIGVLTGTVRSALSGGMVLPGVTVSTLSGGYSIFTDSSGRYALAVGAPGPHTLTFSKSGYATYQAAPVVVVAGTVSIVNATLGAATTFSRLSDLHAGDYAFVSGPIATCNGTTFVDGFFVEDADRTRGIRVVGGVGSESVVEGNSVSIVGTVSTDINGDLYVNADIVSRGPGTEVKRLGMSNGSVASAGNILITIWGKITSVDSASQCFYVDDGSGLTDGTHTGVRVDCSKLSSSLSTVIAGLTTGQFVSVTGVAAREGGTPGLRPRSGTDIR